MTIVAFTGHRSDKLGGYELPNPIYNYVYKETVKIIKEINPDEAISGMAMGFDQWAAVICLREGIPLTAAIPFKGQEKLWLKSSQEQYNKILVKCNNIHIVCEGGYAAWKMQHRNKWMVDNCDILIACWDGTSGGTENCIQYAEKIGREIYRIDPNDHE